MLFLFLLTASCSAARAFPQSLGPFQVVPVPQESLDASSFDYNKQSFLQSSESTMWELRHDKAAALGFGEDDIVTAQFSPLSPITLEQEHREKLQIPSDAKSFAWSYPIALASLPQSVRQRVPTEVANFFEIGGFVYVDERGNLKSFTTLVEATSDCDGLLEFGTPQKWKHEYTRELEPKGRFQEITLDGLKDVAKSFLWLLPNEIIHDSNGNLISGELENPHGGFAYLLPGGGEVFFAVLGKEDLEQRNISRQAEISRQYNELHNSLLEPLEKVVSALKENDENTVIQVSREALELLKPLNELQESMEFPTRFASHANVALEEITNRNEEGFFNHLPERIAEMGLSQDQLCTLREIIRRLSASHSTEVQVV